MDMVGSIFFKLLRYLHIGKWDYTSPKSSHFVFMCWSKTQIQQSLGPLKTEDVKIGTNTLHFISVNNDLGIQLRGGTLKYTVCGKDLATTPSSIAEAWGRGMWASALNGSHQSGPCTFPQHEPRLPSISTGRLGCNKILNCHMWNHTA